MAGKSRGVLSSCAFGTLTSWKDSVPDIPSVAKRLTITTNQTTLTPGPRPPADDPEIGAYLVGAWGFALSRQGAYMSQRGEATGCLSRIFTYFTRARQCMPHLPAITRQHPSLPLVKEGQIEVPTRITIHIALQPLIPHGCLTIPKFKLHADYF